MSDTAREVWLLMSDLVLENTRRREVSEALGMSFGRSRAIRRLARQPLSMRELADALGIEAPNATVVVDDLEAPAPDRPAGEARRGDAQGQGARAPGGRDPGHAAHEPQRPRARGPRDAAADPGPRRRARLAAPGEVPADREADDDGEKAACEKGHGVELTGARCRGCTSAAAPSGRL